MPSIHANRPCSRSAFSLTEMILSIAMIGILSAVAIVSFGNLKSKSEASIGGTLLEQLNDAIKEYEQNAWAPDLAADDASGADELAVLRSLQWRSPTNPSWGSPYFMTQWSPVVSSDEATYRFRWTGTYFALLEPGDAGTGLLYDPDDPQTGDPFDYPADYKPLGHP